MSKMGAEFFTFGVKSNSIFYSMKKASLLLFFLLVQLTVFAQEAAEQEFETDRPSKTEASSLVPNGYFQLETGAQFERNEYGDLVGKEWLYPQALVRVGISSIVEFRAEGTFRRQQTWSGDQLAYQRKGLSTVRVGSKVNVLQEKGLVPELSLLLMLELPLGKEGYKPENVAPEFKLLLSNHLTDRIQLQYNVGYRKEPEYGEMEEKIQYSATLSGKLTDRISLFGEYFGEKTNTNSENNIDGGLQFLILPNLQIDAIIGTNLSLDVPNFFTGVGLSLRLPQ
ncbi:hypothetical protein GU926_06050 [Nibribacter ruber]|uniref:Transporter n=1 Tax=Nibribacter ruber TaxID=2698458 RepID=A0A6P1NVE2_9BACT|nr:transporter [Nibribacter ruber]QHL87020.1 hypothetical protein GU926_06050 [Nibribacter ruber]